MSEQVKQIEPMVEPTLKRQQKIRNYLVGAALVAFVIFVYVLTWVKIATKSL